MGISETAMTFDIVEVGQIYERLERIIEADENCMEVWNLVRDIYVDKSNISLKGFIVVQGQGRIIFTETSDTLTVTAEAIVKCDGIRILSRETEPVSKIVVENGGKLILNNVNSNCVVECAGTMTITNCTVLLKS